MALPAYGTPNYNYRFNGETTEVVVIHNDGTYDWVIVWDFMDYFDQKNFDDLVQLYGTTTSSGVIGINVISGYQTALFRQSKLGTDPTGLVSSKTYTTVINVDGTDISITVDGSAAQDYDGLIAEINADLTGATAAIDGNGNITITSDTSGNGSDIVFQDKMLLYYVNDFLRLENPVPGANTLLDAMEKNLMPNGKNYLYHYSYILESVGDKPAIYDGPIPDWRIYYDGSAWYYMYDDSAV